MGWAFSSLSPVYMQIVSRLRADILAGRYTADAPFPSVRQLAFEAAVNPNTMQRALTELENEGLLYSRSTAGRFVRADVDVLDAARRKQCQEELAQLTERARALGLKKQDVIDFINEQEDWEL